MRLSRYIFIGGSSLQSVSQELKADILGRRFESVFTKEQNILLRTQGSRLATRRSTRVSPERPVLRTPGTDNSTHRQVAKQPRMPTGTANPGRVTLPRVKPYLWTFGPIGVLCPQRTPRLLPSDTLSVRWLTRAN